MSNSKKNIRNIARNLLCQYSCGESIICTWGRSLFVYNPASCKVQGIARTPNCHQGIFRRILSDLASFRPISFLTKSIGVLNVIPIDDSRYVVFFDKIYLYDCRSCKFLEILDLSTERIYPPLPYGACDDGRGSIYFGEYQNHRPYSARIIKICTKSLSWSIAYTFPLGKVKHIHSITYDPWRYRFWVSTGDTDSESCLFFTEDCFESVHCLGWGDQGWRMVSLVPLEDRLVWGSDLGRDVKDPSLSNYIYEYDFSGEKRNILQKVDNPIYYSYMTPGGKILFGTTYEPESVVGTEPKVGILSSEDGRSWTEVASFKYKYKIRPYGSKHGTIFFTGGQVSDEVVYFTPINVEGYDGRLLSLDLSVTKK